MAQAAKGLTRRRRRVAILTSNIAQRRRCRTRWRHVTRVRLRATRQREGRQPRKRSRRGTTACAASHQFGRGRRLAIDTSDVIFVPVEVQL